MPLSRTLGFGSDARLTSRTDFQRLFASGRRISGRNLNLWFCVGPDSSAPARLGLSVSAKVGNAVRRNRLKRLTREAFRLNRAHLKLGSDLVAALRPNCHWTGLQQAQSDFMEICRKADLIAG